MAKKKDDCMHINVSELDAILRGVNLAIKWNIREFVLMTDSATVLAWVNSVLTGERKARTHGMSEMLVKRRLGLLRELCSEYGLKVTCELVSSNVNKEDCLTRVPNEWLKIARGREETRGGCAWCGWCSGYAGASERAA